MKLKKLTAFMVVFAMLMAPVRSLADCPNAISLGVGEKVTDCPRIGLSLEYDKQVRKDLIEGDFNKKIVEEQKKLIDMKDLQMKYTIEDRDLWKAEAIREREALDKERNKTNWGLWGGLIGGIALTVLAGWAVGQAGK